LDDFDKLSILGYDKDYWHLRSKGFDIIRFYESSLILKPARDCVFINCLRNNCRGKRVVGIVGKGHMEGIVEHWERLETRMEEVAITKNDLSDPGNKNMFNDIRARRLKVVKNFNLY